MMNQRGSSLVIVIVIVLSAMVATLVVTKNSASISKVYSRKNIAQSADNLTQVISTMLSNQNICLQGFDGNGVHFFDANNRRTNFNFTLASSPNGQNVTLPSNVRDRAGRFVRFAPGLEIPNTNLRVRRVYLDNPVDRGSGIYYANLKADFLEATQDPSTRAHGLSTRTLMIMQLETSAGVLTACGAAPSPISNRAMCEGMNCTYNLSASGEGSCYCPIQPVQCGAGRYIGRVNNGVPQCNMQLTNTQCAGANTYIVAFDDNGGLICAQISRCPTGTSTTGLGGAANPAECRCNLSGYIWNGSSCALPPPPPTPSPTPSGSATPPPSSPSGCPDPNVPSNCCIHGTTGSSITVYENSPIPLYNGQSHAFPAIKCILPDGTEGTPSGSTTYRCDVTSTYPNGFMTRVSSTATCN